MKFNINGLDNLREACAGCIAKTSREDSTLFLPLWMHLADTAASAGFLYDFWLSDSVKDFLKTEEGLDEELCRKILIFSTLTHDFGKTAAFFQKILMENIPDYSGLGIKVADAVPMDTSKTRHEKITDYILSRYGISDSMAVLAGSHHGRPYEYAGVMAVDTKEENLFGKNDPQDYYRMWDEMLNAVLELCGAASVREFPTFSVKAEMILSGLLIMADWISSNPEYFPCISIHEDQERISYEERIHNALEQITIPPAWMSSLVEMDEEVFKDRFGFKPNDLQKTVLDIFDSAQNPGLVILEAPMGMGKTEAAFAAADAFAAGKPYGGVFLGMPSQATANGLFLRFANWVQKEAEESDSTLSILLSHSKAMQNPDYRYLASGQSNIDTCEPEYGVSSDVVVERWFSGRKLSMLPDMVIGTIDQILISCLRQKHIMLRHLGMASKIVILDEVHSFDEYTSEYLHRVLEWLGAYHCPVILLSATLSMQKKTKLIQSYLKGRDYKARLDPEKIQNLYPSVIWTQGTDVFQRPVELHGEGKTVQIQRVEVQEREAVLNQVLGREGAVGIILNTVARCQEMAERLKKLYPDRAFVIFHSRFTALQRSEIEKEVVAKAGKKSEWEQRKNLVVIGTQVLEQSLDIDFDYMITELAPVDLLLQRIGRLHRHERNYRKEGSIPICYVINALEEKNPSQVIYGRWLLHQTWKNLPDQIQIPRDLPVLIESVYRHFEPEELSEYEQNLLKEELLNQQDRKGRAKTWILGPPEKDLGKRSSFRRILMNAAPGMEEEGIAAVRDGQSSIQVILVIQDESDEYVKIPGSQEKFCKTEKLSSQQAYRLMGAQISLPRSFSEEYRVQKTIRWLEDETRREFSQWQEISALKGELVLKIDQNMEVILADTRLRYDETYGLMEVRKED